MEADDAKRAELILQLQEIAAQLGLRTVSKSQFRRHGGPSEYILLRYFDSWNSLVAEAGLEPTDMTRLSDDELFRAMHDAFVDTGGLVSRTRFSRACRHSESAYRKRWGRWQSVLFAFREWAETNAPDFPYLAELPQVAPSATDGRRRAAATQPAWESRSRTQLGPLLNFRGLQHAPINEQGVVFLFGMVAVDLGYMVEGVGTGYPDCEAKRSVSPRGDKWERVRIEFEYRSRNFHEHGHDPTACDVIVCWEHDWPECPVEVLDLRRAIADLDR